jgi:hypothetical protein
MAVSLIKVVILLACLSVSSHLVPLVTMSRYKQLKCYQCKSNSSADVLPLCDNSFWKLTTKDEKLSMQFLCPCTQAHYCFKEVSWKNDIVLTDRGCWGPVDKWGTVLNKGCMHMKQQNITVCLCGSDLCNYADWGLKSTPSIMFGLCLLVLFSR